MQIVNEDGMIALVAALVKQAWRDHRPATRMPRGSCASWGCLMETFDPGRRIPVPGGCCGLCGLSRPLATCETAGSGTLWH